MEGMTKVADPDERKLCVERLENLKATADQWVYPDIHMEIWPNQAAWATSHEGKVYGDWIWLGDGQDHSNTPLSMLMTIQARKRVTGDV